MNETGRRVREQYADTGGFTDHVFAACSILGYAFVPRIRDLPSKRLYVFERAGVPKHLRPLVGGKVNADLIDRNWADILRIASTMAVSSNGVDLDSRWVGMYSTRRGASTYCPLSEARAPARAFVFWRVCGVTYFAYLDEFGHIGPYISRTDPKYKTSPVFGLAGFVLPAVEVRGFGTWFFQRKCELLQFEIERSGEHPAVWEKKGASLFTLRNVTRYPELRVFTNRLLNKIERLGGFVFYVGIKKTAAPAEHDPNQLYRSVLVEAIKRINDFCEQNNDPHQDSFIVILDEHDQRSVLITAAAQSMYGNERRRHLIEPPFHVESHRYQTLQAADWITGLVGRLGAIWAAPEAYPENEPFRRYFEHRVNRASRRSGIRTSAAARSTP